MAATDIPAGGSITVAYTDPFLATGWRREKLRFSKFFLCRCSRCKDPTELGLYIGSPCCNKCRGKEELAMMVSTDPLNDDALWRCEKCAFELPGLERRQVSMIENDPTGQLFHSFLTNGPPGYRFLSSVQHYEDFLRSCLFPIGCYHPNSYYILDAKFNLINAYGNAGGYSWRELSNQQIERKLSLCREMLAVLDKLIPGFNETRGSLLKELYLTIMESMKRDLGINPGGVRLKLSKPEVDVMLEDAAVILKEVEQIVVVPWLMEDVQRLWKDLKAVRNYVLTKCLTKNLKRLHV